MKTKNSHSRGKHNGRSAVEKTNMPIPDTFAPSSEAGGDVSMGMQAPLMTGPEAEGGAMPKPGLGRMGPISSGGMNMSPGAMPNASAVSRIQPTSSPSRFPPSGASRSDAESYEPGIIEVQFRDGIRPSLKAAASGYPSEVHSANQGPIEQFNRILQQNGLTGAETTFLITHEEALSAQETARNQGVDAPHLGHFITLHFPGSADTKKSPAN
jgi:hypothetical protein